MFEGVLLVAGLLMAVFVGVNIGGSSTGVAFGPAVGSDAVTKLLAAALMTAFAFLGGSTAGREVIETLSRGLVPSETYTLVAAIVVLFFVGAALLVSNLFGVPASTSMTVVSAIAGMGAATGTLRWDVLGGIVTWWLIAPILAFWTCAVVGRYLYPALEARFAVDRSPGPLLVLDRSGAVPVPRLGGTTDRREFLGTVLVVAIACYMAFSAGASNYANAVGPLVGNGAVSVDQGVALAAVAVGLGAFTVARRTLDTVGNDLTELPVLAALVVETVSATIISLLSAAGIPASLAVSATMSVVGLGWGRATRTTTVAEAASTAVSGEQAEKVADGDGMVAEASDADGDEPTRPADLFDPSATARVVVLWLLTPTISATGAFVVFAVAV